MSQHTPGSWEVAHEPTGFAIVGPLPDRFVVAHVPMHLNDRTVTADAQLIAAAPDLLWACKVAIAGLNAATSGTFHGVEDEADTIREAIAKATRTPTADRPPEGEGRGRGGKAK